MVSVGIYTLGKCWYLYVFSKHGNHEIFSRTAYGTILRSTQKSAENIKNRTTVEKSLTFHLVLHPSLSSTTDPGRRADLPSASLIGLLAEAGSSFPPYPPGRLHVVAPSGLTQREGHRAGRATSECTIFLKSYHGSRANLHATLIQNRTVLLCMSYICALKNENST